MIRFRRLQAWLITVHVAWNLYRIRRGAISELRRGIRSVHEPRMVDFY